FDVPYALSLAAQAGEPDFEREPNDAAARATAWPDGAATMRGHLAPGGGEGERRRRGAKACARAGDGEELFCRRQSDRREVVEPERAVHRHAPPGIGRS